MPYRVDISCPIPNALDTLVQLGALDIEASENGLAAIVPDDVTSEMVAHALDVATVGVSPAVARDNGSVWLVSPKTTRIGRISIASAKEPASPMTLRLIDSDAFGSGHHPTTAMCVEAIEEILADELPDSILDVGTGSGILALSALLMGVPQAVGLDIDAGVLQVAEENARLNGFQERLQLIHGSPDSARGHWQLVVANLLPAPLIELALVLVQRLAPRGRLVLSGIPCSLESEVRQAYQHLGIGYVDSETRAGWTMLVLQPSW